MHGSDEDLSKVWRQAWEGWGDALRQMGGAPPAAPWATGAPWPGQWPGAGAGLWPGAAGAPWAAGMPWAAGPPWGGMAGFAPPPDPLAGLERMAREWMGRMQETAAQFVGRDSTPDEIVDAWRRALGATPERPDPDLFGQFFAQGLAGIEQVSGQMQAWLQAVQGPWQRWAHLPAFGPTREHQERWQALLAAQGELQDSLGAFQQLLEQAGREAFELFQGKLTELADSGRHIDTARGLFDLWIDAAEEAWSSLALSPQFQQVYGALANAQLKVRAGLQREIEQTCVAMGMPGRTEVEESSRKIAELERALRRLRAAMARAGLEEGASASAAAQPPSAPKRSRARPAASTASTVAADKPAAARPAKARPPRKAGRVAAAAAPAPGRRAASSGPATAGAGTPATGAPVAGGRAAPASPKAAKPRAAKPKANDKPTTPRTATATPAVRAVPAVAASSEPSQAARPARTRTRADRAKGGGRRRSAAAPLRATTPAVAARGKGTASPAPGTAPAMAGKAAAQPQASMRDWVARNLGKGNAA